MIPLLSLLILLPYFVSVGLNKGLVLGSGYCDIASYFVPIRSYGFGLLAKGILPLWNPYIFSGMPFLAESQLAIFYPFNLIYLILPVSLASNMLILMHQVLAGIFMYLYIKHLTRDSFSSFIGAIVFSLSSGFITRIFAGHITIVCAIAWLPLLFLLVDKALSKKGSIFILLAGLALSLQILGGHIQIVFISLVALFLYVCYITFNNYRKKFTLKETVYPFYAFMGLAIFGAGLSAIQILPSLELMKATIRFDNSIWNQMFSMPPENIITILSPGFFGWIKNGIYWGKWYPWETCIYVGILPLLLSSFAIIKKDKFTKFFTGLFLLSMILSLGAYLPINRLVYKYMPGFNLFRANGRFLILGVFSLSVLTALGCRNLYNYADGATKRKSFLVLIFWLILIFTLLSIKFILIYLPGLWNKILSFIISYDQSSTQAGYNFGYLFNFISGKKIVNSSLNNSVIWILLSTLLFILCLKFFMVQESIPLRAQVKHFPIPLRKSLKAIAEGDFLVKENLKKILIATFIVTDLWSFGSEYFSTFPLKNCYLDNKTVTFLKSNIGQSRYLPVGNLFLNAGMMDGIPSIGGYSGCVQARYNEFINFTQGYPLDMPIVLGSIKKQSRLFQLLNLKYILVNKYVKSDFSNLEQVYNNGGIIIYKNPLPLPKAFIVHKAKVITDRDGIFKTLSDSSFNFRDTVILEEPVNLTGTDNSILIPEPEPIITTYSPNRVVVKAEVETDGYLVLCDTYNPGWKAYVDGKKIKILKADYILRAVKLEPGKHTIEFLYSPASLKIGAFITLSFLALSIVMLIAFIKRYG